MSDIHFATGSIVLAKPKIRTFNHIPKQEVAILSNVAFRILSNIQQALADHGELPDVVDVANDLARDLQPKEQ